MPWSIKSCPCRGVSAQRERRRAWQDLQESPEEKHVSFPQLDHIFFGSGQTVLGLYLDKPTQTTLSFHWRTISDKQRSLKAWGKVNGLTQKTPGGPRRGESERCVVVAECNGVYQGLDKGSWRSAPYHGGLCALPCLVSRSQERKYEELDVAVELWASEWGKEYSAFALYPQQRAGGWEHLLCKCWVDIHWVAIYRWVIHFEFTVHPLDTWFQRKVGRISLNY